MSALVQIRNVPEATRRELKVRAAHEGMSMNAYLLRLLEREVAHPPVADVLRRATVRGSVDLSGDEIVEEIHRGRAERDEQVGGALRAGR